MHNLSETQKYDKFRVHLADQGSIYWDQVEQAVSPDKTVLLAIPLRLGILEICEEYLQQLKHCFTLPHFVGMVGGQDSKAYYFTGVVAPHAQPNPLVLYLDPHIIQPCAEVMTPEAMETYRCR